MNGVNLLPSIEQHRAFLEKSIGRIVSDIQLFETHTKKGFVSVFRRPYSDDQSTRIDENSVVEYKMNWGSAFQTLYGDFFEKYPLLDEAKEHLQPFYDSLSSPPDDSGKFATDVRALLWDVLSRYTPYSNKPELNIPNFDEITKLSYDFLTRDSDDIYIEAPLLGISVPEPINFEMGKIVPLSLEQRVDLMRDTDDLHRGFHLDPYRMMGIHSLLIVKINQKRNEKFLSVVSPGYQQRTAMSIASLLKIFGFGGVQPLLFRYAYKGIGMRYSSTHVFGKADTYSRSNTNFVNDFENLGPFIDKHFSDSGFEENHSMSFILDSMDDAWNSGRGINSKIFDYAAMLEAILLPDAGGEISFKVSLYTAHLFAKDGGSKEEIFNLIKKAYAVRNAIAHCRPKVDKKEELSQGEQIQFFSIVHKIIRRAFDLGLENIRKEARELILK